MKDNMCSRTLLFESKHNLQMKIIECVIRSANTETGACLSLRSDGIFLDLAPKPSAKSVCLIILLRSLGHF